MFKKGDVVKFNKDCKYSFGSFKPNFNKSYIIESVSNVHPFFISIFNIDDYVFEQSKFTYDINFYRKEKINKIKKSICSKSVKK